MRPARSPSRERPQQSLRLLAHPTDRFLLLYMLAVLVTTVFVLVWYWDGQYSQPLREWLIVNAALTTLRTCGRIGMRVFPTDRWRTLRSILIWFFRFLTLASLAWFIAGIRFLRLESRQTQGEHGPVHLLITIIISFELIVLCLSIILCIVIFLFALHPVLTGRQGPPAATEEDLVKLRLFKFSPDDVIENGNDTELSCSICLCDYEPDDLLRELPCAVGRHVFHAKCVDGWLTQKLSCPICRDDPLGRTQPEQQSEQDPPNDEQT